MAKFEDFAGKLLRLEGVNHPLDKNILNFKVALSAWMVRQKERNNDIDGESIMRLTEEDAARMAKKIFWDFYQADKILNQSVAEFIVEWGYKSGRMAVALIVQRLLGVLADGIFGRITLSAINGAAQSEFYEKLKNERQAFDTGWPKVEILRTYQAEQTIGGFYIDGIEFCKTLELKWMDNIRNKSCIPEGRYRVVKRLAHEKRKYNHFHVTNVPNRSYILIHTGNYSSQILGCVLVGDIFIDLNKDGLVDVANSTVTLERLYDSMPNEFDLDLKENILSM